MTWEDKKAPAPLISRLRVPAMVGIILGLFALMPPAAQALLRVDINAGVQEPMPIAIPGFAPENDAPDKAIVKLGNEMGRIISNDLSNSGLFRNVATSAVRARFAEVTQPPFAYWNDFAAQAIVTGFVRVEQNGDLFLGCYLYDVLSQTELARTGFVAPMGASRRLAHKCADFVYSRLTGQPGYFDTRIAYIAETGSAKKRIKRLAIMDFDGANHQFITNGQNIVLTPRFDPERPLVAYMSFADNAPQLYIYDLAKRTNRALMAGKHMSFAPRFSPDGRTLVFSVSSGGGSSIYRFDLDSKKRTRLTYTTGIDTAPGFSPDGKQIIFESDRSGSQQLYVMNADGSDPRRISFTDGQRYGSPVWSPRGDYIAFTRMGDGKFRIGVMKPDGSGERLLTDAWMDEGPTWAPNGQIIVFSRSHRQGGRVHRRLRMVDLNGLNERRLPTPLDASDPAFSPLLP